VTVSAYYKHHQAFPFVTHSRKTYEGSQERERKIYLSQLQTEVFTE